MILLSLVLGTLVSEDLTCIAAGLLIQRAEVGVGPALLACSVGIFVGDVALWALGRVFGHGVLAWRWLAHQLPASRADHLRQWLSRHAAVAIVGSRFLPGTRLPLYLVAGLVELPGSVFATWALVGTILWTPPLVLLSAGLARAVADTLPLPHQFGWLASTLPAVVVLLVLHVSRRIARPV